MARKVAVEQLELEVAHPKPLTSLTQSALSNGMKDETKRPTLAQLLETPGALLTRSHLRELGLERRAVDAVFRALPIVALPGYSRPMIHADQFLELVEHCTYRDDRVRPCHA